MPPALRNFILTFAVSLLVFGIMAYAGVGFVLDSVIGPVPDITTPPAITLEGDDPIFDPEDTSEDPSFTDEIVGESFNILLIGSDYQPEIFDDYDYEEKWPGPGFPDKRNRPWCADMIILLRIDKASRQFVICPIPRNIKRVVDRETVRLGDTIAKKNTQFLCGKVSELTGLPIDYYIHIRVGQIASCIDALGAITFDIPLDMKYEDSEQKLIIDLKKGTHKMTGAKTAQLLRYMGYSNGSVGRTNITVDFLKAMLDEYLSPKYIDEALNIYSKLKDKVETNFTEEVLANNLDLIFSYPDFETVTLTYPGSTRVEDDVTYFIPDTSAASALFAKYENR